MRNATACRIYVCLSSIRRQKETPPPTPPPGNLVPRFCDATRKRYRTAARTNHVTNKCLRKCTANRNVGVNGANSAAAAARRRNTKNARTLFCGGCGGFCPKNSASRDAFFPTFTQCTFCPLCGRTRHADATAPDGSSISRRRQETYQRIDVLTSARAKQ